MGWSNFDDVLGQMQAFGLDIEAQDVVIGTRRRCRAKDGGREKRGWFQLYELPKADGSGLLIVGSFGCFWGAENVVQKVELPSKERKAMSSEQLDALKARIAADKKKAEAEAKRRADEAARHADYAWRKCVEGSRDQSEYLKRKVIETHGGRFSPGGNFIIPMQDTERRTYGLQVIYPAKKNGRDKDFWPAGLAKKGHFFLIGGIPDRLLLIAEGFATAASLHQATKLPVAVAFDAGNLLPVAKNLRAKYKRAKILICADDDYRTEGNPGVTHARNAAMAVEGEVVFPVFTDARPTGTKGPTDFNDLHLLEGLHLVTQQVEATITALGWSATPAARGSAGQPGGGEQGERRQAQSVMDLDDVVERFVPLDDGTGDYVFDTWTKKIAKRSQMIALLPAGVRGDDIKRHPIWITRGAYFLEQVGFDPSMGNERIKLNMWQGWPIKPSRGQCDNILDHIRFLVSAEENADEVFNFILDSLAFPLQNPGVKLASAMIFHGDQGSGKSLIFDTVMSKIYGATFKKISQRRIENQFTDWARNRLFVVIEEISASSDIWHIKGEFKDMVTSDTFDINDKNEKWVEQRNMINFVLLSNEQMPIPLENGDRRHLVVYTPPKPSDRYIAGLISALEEETPNFYGFLLDRDLSNFHRHKRPPMTSSKQRLINISLPSEAVFINEWIDGQIEFNGNTAPLCPCLGTDLYSVYSAWAKRHNIARPRDLAKFIGYISSLPGWEAGKPQSTYENLNSLDKKNRKMVVPADEAFDKAELGSLQSADGYLRRGNDHKNIWLTQGFFKFRNAIEASR